MNHISKVNIDISTYILLLISLLSGYFEYVFLLIITITIHELGHFLIGSLLKLKMKRIDIFMFGGVTILDENLNVNIYKELIMLLAGPVTQLIFFIIIFIIYKNGFINNYTFDKFKNINFLLFKFNLLPILPLDGGKLLNNILDLIIPYNLSHKISIIVGFIFLPFIFIIFNGLIKYLVLLFLIIKLIEEIINHKNRLTKLIIERTIYNINFKRNNIIHNIKEVKRNAGYQLFLNYPKTP